MKEAAKYILVAFLALLVVATGAYVDCRLSGGSPEACRVIYRSTGDFITHQHRP